MDDKNNLCSVCHFIIQPDWYFCPNCGKAFKEKLPDISVFRQIYIYGISFFLAPLGLVWGLKYVRSTDKKTRLVGIISIALTALSIILIIFVFKGFIDQYAKMLNNFGSGNGNYNFGL